MGLALVVIIAFCILANQMTEHAANPSCIIGPHHKASPSPEPDIRKDTACSRYSSLSCCTANTSHSIDQHGDRELYNFYWDDCGVISTACERYLKAESCFFSCDPYIGQWKGSEVLSLSGLPICAAYCDDWFEACKDVLLCAQNWITDFNPTIDPVTGRFHCVNETCRTFAQCYRNGEGMCETMWGDSFQYDEDNTNCMVMLFTGGNPNSNVMKDASGAGSVTRWQRSLLFLFAVFPYILLQL